MPPHLLSRVRRLKLAAYPTDGETIVTLDQALDILRVVMAGQN